MIRFIFFTVTLCVSVSTGAELLQEDANQAERYGFYTGVSADMMFHSNSQVFVDGIKAVGAAVKDLLTKGDSNGTIKDKIIKGIVKKFITEQIDDISQFQGKINFQSIGGAVVGYHIGKNGRIESEILNSKIEIEDNQHIFDKSANIFTFLLNTYYNPSIKNTQFSPYISLGIGPTMIRVKKFVSKSSVPLNIPWVGYQTKLGVDYSINQDMDVSLGYRYFSVPIPVADDISTHSIELGLRISF